MGIENVVYEISVNFIHRALVDGGGVGDFRLIRRNHTTTRTTILLRSVDGCIHGIGRRFWQRKRHDDLCTNIHGQPTWPLVECG